MHKSPIDYEVYTEDELLEMKKSEATKGLTELQQRFCEEYIRSYNVKMATIRAGYPEEKIGIGAALRRKPECQLYIQWLKARVLRNVCIDAATILDEHLRIAFADITDFVDIRPTSIRLRPSELVDGQLVKSIKSGRDGVSIELYDKMKSLDFLAKYCQDMPKDWKQKLEERRMELQEQEFELKKSMANVNAGAEEKDGFIEAIENAAKVVWEE